MKPKIVTIGQTALAFFKDAHDLQEFQDIHSLNYEENYTYLGLVSSVTEEVAETFIGLNDDFIDYYAAALAVSWKGKGSYSTESALKAFLSFVPKGYDYALIWEPLSSIKQK